MQGVRRAETAGGTTKVIRFFVLMQTTRLKTYTCRQEVVKRTGGQWVLTGGQRPYVDTGGPITCLCYLCPRNRSCGKRGRRHRDFRVLLWSCSGSCVCVKGQWMRGVWGWRWSPLSLSCYWKVGIISRIYDKISVMKKSKSLVWMLIQQHLLRRGTCIFILFMWDKKKKSTTKVKVP